MPCLSQKLAAGWVRLQNSVVTALIILFLVRFFSVLLNLHSNLGGLIRPHLFYSDTAGWVSLLLFIAILLLHHRSLTDFSEKTRLRLCLVFPFAYVFLALFTGTAGNKTYIYRLIEGQLGQQDFIAMQTMDLFFEGPYTFWVLCWFLISYVLARNFSQEKYLDLLWAAPFFLLSFLVNNIQAVSFTAFFILTIHAVKFFSQISPKWLHAGMGITFAAVILGLKNYSIIYSSTLLAGAIILPITWLTGLYFIKTCEAETENSRRYSHAWFFLPLFSGILSLGVSASPMGPSLFNFWFLLVSFNYAFSAIVPLLLAFLVAFLVGLKFEKAEKPVFALLILTFAVFYLGDALVYLENGQRLNYHTINWVLGLENLFSLVITSASLVSRQTMAILALTPLLLVAGYATLVKDILPLKKNRFRPILTSILIVAAISLTGITAVSELPYLFQDPTRIFLATAPIFENIFVQRPEFKKLSNDFDQIGFSFKDSTAAFESSQNQFRAPAKPKNLVLIMLESTGNEYISLFGGKDQTWPKLQSLKNRIEIFPFYFSTFPESANADFSTMTSLMPSNFHILQRKPEFSEATLIEYLHKNNYDCSMFFSGFLGDTGLLSFYRTRKFDRIYDALSLPEILPENSWIWGVKEHVMVDRIKQLLFTRSRKKEKPFFVYYRMIFPHAPFNTIEENSQPQFSENDLMEGKWTGRFKNCLLYMDTQIFRVIESLKEAGLEQNTYVVIMSDHATMLGKDGVYGHGWNLEPELTNVPFLIIHPEEIGFKTNETPGSHIDIMPTLLNLLQISCNDKRIVQGTDLRSSSTHDRRIFLSSFNHKALIENNLYYWYLEDLNQARVFSFEQIEGKTVFSPQTAADKETVMKKVRKIKRLTSLQKTLLLNFEHYNRLYREESSND